VWRKASTFAEEKRKVMRADSHAWPVKEGEKDEKATDAV